jgi:hypothetical protein
MIIAFINYVRELSIFTICHPVKLRHSQQYITTAQGGGFLRGNKIYEKALIKRLFLPVQRLIVSQRLES